MFEHLLASYSHLPFIVKVPLEFWFNIIIVRGIIANDIVSELKQHGLFPHDIVANIMKHLDQWTVIARKSAIVTHYRLHAKGVGHESDSVLGCGQGRCAIF